jgi:hypothetical protein
MTGRLVRIPNGAPAACPAGAEARVLRAVGDAYAALAGAAAGAAWPTLGELTGRATLDALDAEAIGCALGGLERRGLLRVLPRRPPPAAGAPWPPPQTGSVRGREAPEPADVGSVQRPRLHPEGLRQLAHRRRVGRAAPLLQPGDRRLGQPGRRRQLALGQGPVEP